MSNASEPSNRPSGRMNGGRAMAEMLRLAGAGPMFGMGGFQLLPFYDALAQLGMQHFLINDERCGAFAADQTPGSTINGWGLGPSSNAAKARAISECSNRGGNCQARVWACE